MNKLTLLVISLVSMSLSAADNQTTVSTKAMAPAETAAKSAEVIPMQFSELPEVGRGRFDYLFWHVYDARLQSVDGQFVDYQQSAPVLLSLTYQRDISKELNLSMRLSINGNTSMVTSTVVISSGHCCWLIFGRT